MHPGLHTRPLAAALLAAFVLAGCAGDAHHRPRRDEPPRHAGAGQQPAVALQVQAFEVLGRRVVLTRANSAAGQPVVVYLPGLGQPAEAGQRWHAAWAEAGYTVLSLQPLEADAAAWRSELARNGEFRELGRLHYGDALRAERLQVLRRLRPALEAARPDLDWAHAALAGYETGAQTALDARADAGWQALIAISPPAMQAPAAGGATLLVTSELDHDPLGLISRPAERRQAFDAMQPGAAWLLNLRDGSHAGLAGTRSPDAWQAQDQHETRAPRMGGAGRGGRGDGGGAPGAVARGPRSGSVSEAALADLADALRDSTAFLDAQLRGRPLAAPRLEPR